jgi:hypothetical protein
MQQSSSPVIEAVAAAKTAVVLLLVHGGSAQPCETTLGFLSASNCPKQKFMQHVLSRSLEPPHSPGCVSTRVYTNHGFCVLLTLRFGFSQSSYRVYTVYIMVTWPSRAPRLADFSITQPNSSFQQPHLLTLASLASPTHALGLLASKTGPAQAEHAFTMVANSGATHVANQLDHQHTHNQGALSHHNMPEHQGSKTSAKLDTISIPVAAAASIMS